MASQPVIEAAARESRANAREDLAVLTAGAREKVDGAMASMQAFGQTLLHPLDKKKKEDAQATAEQQKQAAREKRDEIRSIAAQQAATERASARGVVAKGVAETGGARYPVLSPTQPQPTTESHGEEAADYHPNHPPIVDEPYENNPDAPHALNQTAEPHTTEPYKQNLATEGLDTHAETHTGAPQPVDGLSRESKSGEFVEDAGDSKGVEDADFYPSPRIVKT